MRLDDHFGSGSTLQRNEREDRQPAKRGHDVAQKLKSLAAKVGDLEREPLGKCGLSHGRVSVPFRRSEWSPSTSRVVVSAVR
jgi:hypothetical protein